MQFREKLVLPDVTKSTDTPLTTGHTLWQVKPPFFFTAKGANRTIHSERVLQVYHHWIGRDILKFDQCIFSVLSFKLRAMA